MPVFETIGKLKQEDYSEFKTSLRQSEALSQNNSNTKRKLLILFKDLFIGGDTLIEELE